MRLRKKMTAGFLPNLFILVAMLVVACGGGGGGTTPTTRGSPVPPDKQIYITGIDGAGIADLPTFDPALVLDFNSATAIYRVFTGMVELNDQFRIVCVLCSTYNVGSDGV